MSQGRLCLYASSETHFSIAKAAALLGIGRENVRHIAVDECFRMKTDDLVAKITGDLEAGYVPFCVVANAGTVNTGAVDPLRRSAKSQTASGFGCTWTEVMGPLRCSRNRPVNYSRAWNAPIPSRSILTSGFISRWMWDASSTATHKGARAFAHEAEYTRMIGAEADEAFAFWDYGPELSRRFRALKVWMLLKGVGLDALGEAIESNSPVHAILSRWSRPATTSRWSRRSGSRSFVSSCAGATEGRISRRDRCLQRTSPRRVATRWQFVSLQYHARRPLRVARLRPELSDHVARHGDPARRSATRREIVTDFDLGKVISQESRNTGIVVEAFVPNAWRLAETSYSFR